ncbi:MAG: DUF2130 domain-containing protein [Bdellovibrionales bacterium]|nr:DUF2130 domain-containing protein [Bdellovibrionales bacterium]
MKRKCPVCHTLLSEEKYDKALGIWKSKQAHINDLKVQQRRLQLETKAREKKAAAALNQKLRRERAKMAHRIKSKIERGVQTYKSKMSGLESRLDRYMNLTRKQNRKIGELRTQLKKGITPQELGLLEEKSLLKKLRKMFPDDRFSHTGKVGDIFHEVFEGAKIIGSIVYECKRVKKYSRKFVAQTRLAAKAREADFAVLVTNAFPPKTSGSFVESGVFVISPQALEVLAHSLRNGLKSVTSMNLSSSAKARALQEIFNYLSGNSYQNKVRDLLGTLEQLARDLSTDRKQHETAWKKRHGAYTEMWTDLNSIDDAIRKMMSGQGRIIRPKAKNKLQSFKLKVAS